MRKNVYRKSKLVEGVGVNDADYTVKPTNNGKRYFCNFYVTWREMLRRCYNKRYLLEHPTYYGCSVIEEWHLFSNFKRWMEQEEWEGKHLDKDLLVKGNKIYSPNTCVFVTKQVNNFLTDSGASRGCFAIGVSFHKRDNNFYAYCRNPFENKMEHLGCFDNEIDAHLAWKRRKHELACQLADQQSDPRVTKALRERFA